MVLFGGVGIGPQTTQLKRGVDILVATPGRLLDHHAARATSTFRASRCSCSTKPIACSTWASSPTCKRMLALLPKKRQNLLFSATFSDEIKALADKLLDRRARSRSRRAIRRPSDRASACTRSTATASANCCVLIGHHRWRQVLVFTRTKHGADKLAQRARQRAASRRRAARQQEPGRAHARARRLQERDASQVLVATDIAARGIDIDQLPHVVNFDLPNVPKTTCTASAAPAARATRAKPFRWCASTSTCSCATSSA